MLLDELETTVRTVHDAAVGSVVTIGRNGKVDASIEARFLDRHRVLVVERPAAVISRKIDDVTKSESEENALFDPGVHAPA